MPEAVFGLKMFEGEYLADLLERVASFVRLQTNDYSFTRGCPTVTDVVLTCLEEGAKWECGVYYRLD